MFGEDFVDLTLDKSTAVDDDVPLRQIRKTVSGVRDNNHNGLRFVVS